MTYQTIQIGKKYAIYLPREIAREMGIKEGDRLITKVKGNELILKKVNSKPRTAEYWSKIRIEEVEKVGEEITRKIIE